MNSFGQDENYDDFKTVLGNNPIKLSGFLTPSMSFTTVDGKHVTSGRGSYWNSKSIEITRYL